MDDYIHRESLLKALEEQRMHAPDQSFKIAMNMAEGITEQQPAADVEKVRHAKWCGTGNNDTVFTCSSCRAIKCLKIHTPTCTLIFPKYCEECGAKMDGGAE